MREFTYNIDELENLHKAPSGFFFNDNIIIDNEISNDISPDWDYTKGKVIVVGYLFRDQIRILVAENDDDKEFAKAVVEEISDIGGRALLYSFNRNMEIGNFKGCFDFEVPIKEIKPFNAKGWNKDRFYKELRERKVIPDIRIKDLFEGDASLCIQRWQKYQETGNFQNVMDIVSHNINCLLKESIIQKHKEYFHDNWDIDGRGFMLGEKKR